LYRRFAELVPRLRSDEDYTVDEKSRIVVLTETGVERIESWVGVDNLYSTENYTMTPYVDNALRAHAVYQRDRDYIVKDGDVIIVDEFTGRLMHGRRYSEGLHQAIEAKEQVKVQRESLTLATITFQNYFRMYRKLAGMTGTAATEGEEFHKIYKLDVTVIPTDEPMIRDDAPDVVYRTEEAKYQALVKEVKQLHEEERPVLVGTVSVENSEYLSELLRRQGIPHQVLNAKLHEKEAQVITQAGQPRAVTIATNMAGRGVDILLGGNPEGLAREALRKQGIDLTAVEPEGWETALAKARAETEANRQKILAMGGLQILGTERHEARRIDNQLRGRAGRQGDPGSSRFYLSLQDELMRRFGGSNIAGLMSKLGVEDDIPIEHGMVSRAIGNAQVKVEGYNFDIRKHVLEYDDVVNKQREVIYAERRRILQESSLRGAILGMVGEEIDEAVAPFTAAQHREDWDLTGLWSMLRAFVPIDSNQDEVVKVWESLSPDDLSESVVDVAERTYDESRIAFGRDMWRQLEKSNRSLGELAETEGGLFKLLGETILYYVDDTTYQTLMEKPVVVLERSSRRVVEEAFGKAMSLQRDRQVLLRTVDTLWVRHLTDLAALREGIGLRAYAQQDPLVSYKREAHEMYGELLVGIRHEVASVVLRMGFAVQERRPVQETRTNRQTGALQQGARRKGRMAGADDRAPAGPKSGKVGRNAPCPCGSGKKYKQCCGR
jgi:preprotein translocase subunit SecA